MHADVEDTKVSTDIMVYATVLDLHTIPRTEPQAHVGKLPARLRENLRQDTL
jgi:hypothetical protein